MSLNAAPRACWLRKGKPKESNGYPKYMKTIFIPFTIKTIGMMTPEYFDLSKIKVSQLN